MQQGRDFLRPSAKPGSKHHCSKSSFEQRVRGSKEQRETLCCVQVQNKAERVVTAEMEGVQRGEETLPGPRMKRERSWRSLNSNGLR